MALESVLRGEKNYFKKIKNKIFPYFLAGALTLTSYCGSGGGGTAGNSNNENNNPPVDKPVIEETFDYTTTITPVLSENVGYNGGTIKVDENYSNSAIYGTELKIPERALLYESKEIKLGEVNNPPELPPLENSVLNYVGVPVSLEPSGTNFNESLELKLKYSDEELSDAGINDETKLELYNFNPLSNSWEKVPIESINSDTNEITAKINHFSYYAVVGEVKTPDDLGTPRPGDLLYKTGNILSNKTSNAWMPGHAGVNTGEKKYPGEGLASDDVIKFGLYNVIEALGRGVQYSYYNLPNVIETYEDELGKFENNDLYMGAREPKGGALTDEQREKVVEFVEAQIGKPYAWAQTMGVGYGLLKGSLVKGETGKFNCVGLAEAAYEDAGVNDGGGLTTNEQENVGNGRIPAVLTPVEHYNMTRPAGFEEPEPEIPVCEDIIDTNCDGCVNDDELYHAEEMWKDGKINMNLFHNAIGIWKNCTDGKLPDLSLNSIELQKSHDCSSFPYLKLNFFNSGDDDSSQFNYELIFNCQCSGEMPSKFIFNETFKNKIKKGESGETWIPIFTLGESGKKICEPINLEKLIIDSDNDILESREDNNSILNKNISYLDVENCEPEIPVCKDVIDLNCDECVDDAELSHANLMWKNKDINLDQLHNSIQIWKDCTDGKISDIKPLFAEVYESYGGALFPTVRVGFQNIGDAVSAPFNYRVIIQSQCSGEAPKVWPLYGRINNTIKSGMKADDFLSLNSADEKICEPVMLEELVADSDGEILELREDNNIISNQEIPYIRVPEEPEPEIPVCEDIIDTNCDKCIDREELDHAEVLWKNGEITIGEMMDSIAIWKACNKESP